MTALKRGSASALGAASAALLVGQPEPTAASGIVTTPGNLTLAFNTVVGSFSALSATNSTTPTPSVVTIPTGMTMTVNGPFLIGSQNTSSSSYNNVTNLTGGGSLVVSGTGNFIVGQQSINNPPGAKDTTNSDMSGLSSISVNTTGIFAVGYGANSRGLLSLADTVTTSMPSNFINASEFDVGNSLSDNNVGQCVLTLGQGSNVLQANTFNIGLGKTSGSIIWSSGSGPSSTVSIAGTGGGMALANIIVSGQNSTTSSGNNSSLLLAGHTATVHAGSLAIGENIGNTAGGANGTVTFDTGTFDVGSVSIGAYTSGSSLTGPTGTLTIGGSSPNTSATGIFSAYGSFVMGNVTATTTATATANFTVNGGVANILSNVVVTSTTGNTTSNFTLAGGVLNMTGHAVGGTGALNSGNGPISNIQLVPDGGDTATLTNLGGTGITASGGNSASTGGLTMGGSGTLILDGLNTYTGGTNITSGTLQVGQASSAALSSPLGDASGPVTVNSTLSFGSNNAIVVANPLIGSNPSTINQNGNGTTTLTGTSSFTGQVNVNAGTLLVQGVLNNTGTPGTMTVSGGNLAGSGTTGADVSLTSGSITPDATGAALSVNSLSTGGGTLQFNIDGANIGKISSANSATLSAGQLGFGLISAPTPGNYTIITSTSLTNSLSLSPVSAGRTTFTPSVSGNNLVVNVAGGPASLTWNNSTGGGNGTDWDLSNLNWNSAASSNPHKYFQFDNVTFNDTNNNNYTVNITTNVTPLSLAVTTANTYTFQGSGSITGYTGLTLTGGGTLKLANTGINSYTGATNITNGTLQIAAPGALPNAAAVSLGSTGKLDLDGNSATLGSLSGSGTIGNSSTAANSSLDYSGLGSSTFSGAINDTLPGGNKQTSVNVASGSLVLTANNSYSGATVINSGAALQVGNGSSTGSLGSTTAINNNGQLIYNLTSNPIISNNISGIGQLVQSGSGTLILTGSNSYGPTVINSGTVQVGNGTSAGTLGQSGVTDNGSLKLDLSSNLNIGGAISGTGSVVQAGTGTVIMPNVNTYSGGTTVSSGILQVSGNNVSGLSALGKGNVTVSGGATLIGANADSFGFLGGAGNSPLTINIAGGTVTDLGTASYRITLPNLTFTGGTMTSTAGNNGDANGQYSLQGTALNGAFSLSTNSASTTAVVSASIVSLESNANFNVAAGSVTGGATPGVDLLISSVLRNYTGANVATFTKTGAGVMKLSGVNIYTGPTTVSNGKLVLGVANAINQTSSLTLGDSGNSTSGTLGTGGFNQTVPGTLTLSTNSHIDLGLGGQIGGGAVHFNSSNGLWGSSALTIDNWTPGIDHLFFGNGSAALDPSQVNDITFTNFGAAQITATGEIVPVAAVPTFVLDDVNGDGHFTVADISAEMLALANVTAFQNNYGPSHLVLNSDELYAVLDQNHDGAINNADIQAAITSLANGGGNGAGSVSAVPEPTSWLLLAAGGALLLVGCARKKFVLAHNIARKQPEAVLSTITNQVSAARDSVARLFNP